jgi:penicillin-insensitive murein endopeptidase
MMQTVRTRRVSNLLSAGLLGVAVAGCSIANKGVAPQPSTPANPEPTPPPSRAENTPEKEAIAWTAFDSTSLRNPNDGSLRGGVPLPLTAPGLRFNPARNPKTRYGTAEVVRSLVQAAARVDRELGGLPVTINDLSNANGGPIPHHASHQSGRDVDVFFYQLGPDGEPIESVGALFDPSGAGVDFRDLADPLDDVPLQIDIPRTWLFLRALIEEDGAHLQQIFLAEHLRALLLDYARASGVPSQTIARFEDMTCQPAYPHDDHLHLRFFCAPDDILDGCRDSPPIYPWQYQKLGKAGVQPQPLAPKREKAKAKIVTHEEARQAAGRLHAEVERWLERRQQWLDQPHPGRTYCP